MMNEEDEAFNEIERQAKQRIEAVRAAIDAQNISSCTKWVGLTDEETERLIHNFGADPWTLLDEVEARLKARNT
jgi:hypothetical protein